MENKIIKLVLNNLACEPKETLGIYNQCQWYRSKIWKEISWFTESWYIDKSKAQIKTSTSLQNEETGDLLAPGLVDAEPLKTKWCKLLF